MKLKRKKQKNSKNKSQQKNSNNKSLQKNVRINKKL